MRDRTYTIEVTWTGNLGEGTKTYTGYSRHHEYHSPGKIAPIFGSSDPAFRGDAARYNPEELLVASLSSCHMLWMLHLCADAGIVVDSYEDHAAGVLQESPDGSGRFRQVVLRPRLAIADAARTAEVCALHQRAHRMCFIAASVSFPVHVEPSVVESAKP